MSALDYWRQRRDDLRESIPRRIISGQLSGQHKTAALDALTMVAALVAELEARA